MYRIDNDTAISALPTPEAAGVHPNYYFTKGNPSLGVPATIVTADWANAVQEEISGVIEAAGLTLSKSNQAQLLQAIRLLISGNAAAYAASSTAANTYTVTMSPALLAYAAGQVLYVKFTNHNTGAATINANGLGAKSIVRTDGSALNAYSIVDSMVAVLVYDGTNFVLCNPNLFYHLQNEAYNYAASSTAANTYTATLDPVPLAYTAGMRVSIKFTNHNTGAATINLNSLGAKSITTTAIAALSSGMIGDGMIADLRYDGTQFQLMNPIRSGTPPTQQRFTSGSGTYTTPAGVVWLRVKMVGGGGGGAGSGSATGTAAGAGGSTTFGTSLLTCTGGGAGIFGLTGGAGGGTGGTATINSPAYGTGVIGGTGGGGTYAQTYAAGSMGGATPFGGAGGGGQNQVAGTAASANSGSGGGGAGTNVTATCTSGTGGGAGGFIDAIIPSPSATYAYGVGAAGTAGAAGTNGYAGGAGAAGYIEVTEYYS